MIVVIQIIAQIISALKKKKHYLFYSKGLFTRICTGYCGLSMSIKSIKSKSKNGFKTSLFSKENVYSLV